MATFSRRDLLKAGVATGAGLALSGVAPSFAAPAPRAKPVSISLKPQQKALVFIMLDGGNDSYNMLVPTSDRHYREYQQSRSNLALSKSDLLSLDGFQDQQGRRFGLHNSMPEVQQLFARKKLAFVANIAR